ncbi:hypothetical protein Glove_5g65 [Diversispora epigaea]|uniref:C2H2-type domain-containing protein n=1 Tax=Diversispora epigaea TaxID=1348612 RepID=A0A397K0A3_9GLOM|nr:hypothetical protein Glove_5g65 [Diversispora epigaea]
MSRNFKCTFCENYYLTLNGLSQHLKRCKQTFYSSTEESNEEVSEIISDINDMSLDSEEFQSVLEGLPSSSKTRENPSQDLMNLKSVKKPENPELIEEVLQSQSNEELRNSEFFEEHFRSIEESEIEEPEIEINEFPNEAYTDLMTLVTKHNLNNKAGNAIIKFFNKHSNVSVSPLPKNIVVGRRYMDKMNSRLLYHKHSILSHNNVEYFIHYCPIVNCIENLLSNPEITKHFAYDYEDLTFEGEKSYGEQFTGNWWKTTTLDTLGKSSLHTIYISLGNIPTWRRNKEDAKQLLGYLPIISAKDETEKKSSEFKILVQPENPELIEEVLQSQSNEELRNSEFFEEHFRSIEESEIEEPEIEINEFPNEAYTDLMTLVTKHNLNNKAGNAIIKFFNKHSNVSVSPLPKNIVVGRRYMDKMNSRLLYHKHSILSHNNVEYFIHYCPIVNCIENLLSNPEITKHFAYDYEDLTFEGEKSYGEQFTGNWWKTTTLDTLGKSSLHTIYISLGNIPTWRRNKEDAKQLLGYLPIISAKDETEKKSSEFKILVRKTFYNSIKFLLESLFENASIDLKIDGKRIWFYPRISTVICDWLEACTFSLTYKSSNSNYPCHFCLVSKDNLANTCLRKNQAMLRNKENMKKYYDNDTTKEASLEPVYNYFWDIPDLNIYDATVPDRMHHLDLGLYHYQIEFTKELLSKSLIDKFNRRIVEIPRHPGLKIFAGGLQSIARLTAFEFRDLMKVMVFVVDNLHNKDLSEVYVKWNEMYLLSRLETFKESDLKIFQKAIDDWANLFIKLFRNISGLKFPKLHSWKYHIIDTIRKYGAINRYTTETYESLHKTYVKIPYRLSNKRDVETQIMKMINKYNYIQNIVMRYLSM